MIHTPDSAPCEAKPCGRISQKASNFRVLHHRPLGQLSIFYFLKHRLARPSDKCKISMQDKREKFRYTPRIQPRVKPNPADESAREPEPFESRLFDYLSTAPCMEPAAARATLNYTKPGGPRQSFCRRPGHGKSLQVNDSDTHPPKQCVIIKETDFGPVNSPDRPGGRLWLFLFRVKYGTLVSIQYDNAILC